MSGTQKKKKTKQRKKEGREEDRKWQKEYVIEIKESVSLSLFWEGNGRRNKEGKNFWRKSIDSFVQNRKSSLLSLSILFFSLPFSLYLFPGEVKFGESEIEEKIQVTRKRGMESEVHLKHNGLWWSFFLMS